MIFFFSRKSYLDMLTYHRLSKYICHKHT